MQNTSNKIWTFTGPLSVLTNWPNFSVSPDELGSPKVNFCELLEQFFIRWHALPIPKSTESKHIRATNMMFKNEYFVFI